MAKSLRNKQKTAENCRISAEVGFNYFLETIEENTIRDWVDWTTDTLEVTIFEPKSI
jgi:hypothetical protein